jgi:hypothetical protein
MSSEGFGFVYDLATSVSSIFRDAESSGTPPSNLQSPPRDTHPPSCHTQTLYAGAVTRGAPQAGVATPRASTLFDPKTAVKLLRMAPDGNPCLVMAPDHYVEGRFRSNHAAFYLPSGDLVLGVSHKSLCTNASRNHVLRLHSGDHVESLPYSSAPEHVAYHSPSGSVTLKCDCGAFKEACSEVGRHLTSVRGMILVVEFICSRTAHHVIIRWSSCRARHSAVSCAGRATPLFLFL